MTRRPDSATFLQLLREDLRDYRRLQEQLDSQFEAALRHQSDRVTQVSESIAALTDALDRRRAQRLRLAQRLTGAEPNRCHRAMVDLLPAPSAELLAAWMTELEGLVRECKRLNARNCQLLVEQHEIMQRVLNAENTTYAPV